MKTIKTIITLNARAQSKGVAIINRKIEDGMHSYSMVSKEVYRIEIENNISKLFHYGTLTAEINTATKKVIYLYGQSTSDSDSVSTFLETNNILGYSFGYKPVNGGFYANKNGLAISF